MKNHKRLAELCLRSYHEQTFAINGVEVLVVDNNIVIRGTEPSSFTDIVRNLFGQIGYEFAAYSIYYRCLEIIDRRCPVYITGHSAGGAIAIYLSRLINAKEVVVFGCPRLSESAHNLYSYVYANDAVPKLLFPKKQHSGDLVELGKDRKRWYKLSVQDHFLFNYIGAL